MATTTEDFYAAGKKFAQGDHSNANQHSHLSPRVNIPKYLNHYKISFKTKQNGVNVIYSLEFCPFDTAHVWESSIIQQPSGIIIFQCFHDSCKGKKWADARTVISGSDSLKQFMDGETTSDQKVPETNQFSRAMITGGLAIDEAALKLSSQSDLIKGILPESAGLTVIYGPPSGGKSFVAIDMGLCIATGTDYHGHPVKKKPMLYVAAEGQSGMLVRIKAWLAHHGIDSSALSDFSLLPRPCTIDTPGELDDLLAAIKELPKAPGLIVLDTVARIMSGDENSTADMGKLVRACDRIREQTGAQVVLIHHTGKDATRGARGAIALTGATDCMFKVCQVLGGETDVVGLINDRQKDKELVPPLLFDMRVIDSGLLDADGNKRTSLVLIHNPDLKLTSAKGKASGDKKIKLKVKIAKDVLIKLINTEGETPTEAVKAEIEATCKQLMPSDKVIREKRWREECYRSGISGGEQQAQAKAFREARDELLGLGLIGCYDGFYWRVATK